MAASAVPALDRLADLVPLLMATEEYLPVRAALGQGQSGVVDGAWASSSALATAVVAHDAPTTVLVVLAHPGEVGTWLDELHGFSSVRPELFPLDEERGPRPLLERGTGKRLKVIRQLLGDSGPRLIVAPIGALIQPVPERTALGARVRSLRVGQSLDLDELSAWLVTHGYRRVEAVDHPGDFCRRGGICDIFSPDSDTPVRFELFGDEIESLRHFSPQTQRSVREASEVSILGFAPNLEEAEASPTVDTGHLVDYLPDDARVVLVEPNALREQGRLFLERASESVGLFPLENVFEQLMKRPSVVITAMPYPSVEATCHLHVESVERLSGQIGQVRDELDAIASTERVLIACETEAEVRRLTDVLAAGRLAQSHRLRLVIGRVRAGFRLVGAGVVVLGSHDLFHREAAAVGELDTGSQPIPGERPSPRRRVESRAIDSFLDLAVGDLVVHVTHGIARYHGMQMLQPTDRSAAGKAATPHEEHLLLEFRDGVFVYVPASKIDLVQKYVGSTQTEPELSKFGGTGWARRKEKVEAAVMDLAAEMLDLQAVRAAQPGFAFPPDTDWQKEFEAAFPYHETPDQLTSLTEIKGDMERPRPMDRLLCGDVGFGKTELALRAAFKTIDNAKQVAILVPTTVLAEQHYRTFSQRFAEYPFIVECLSRFRTAKEQRRVVAALAEGSIDVVIGTHRLVSADVRFKELGLVIIDEEQRFGVEHKEKLKHMRATVHVLTLSATPIPRTLHLALLGLRDISNLETPPPDRLPIETRITRFDPAMIRNAIQRELNRGGQVYFVHNRVQSIHEVANRIKEIVPGARTVVGHGQMEGHELEEVMLKFIHKEADVLVATTIIESGLDIPNANTIFINQADMYGLADLHQLRGRVGRHKNRAYAYLLVDDHKLVTPNAVRRLKAIEEFTQLGAGFQIAMRDLEIRGAGNILGNRQSGHIAAVGYEMYCQLLENAVRRLRHQPAKSHLEVTLDLPWPAFLPQSYVPGSKARMEVYRRLSRVRNLKKLADFREELRDRFGTPPDEAEWMLKLAELRILAARWQIESLHRDGIDLVFRYRSEKLAKKLAERSEGRLKVVDAQSLYLRLRPGEDARVPLYTLLRHVLRLPNESV